MRIEIAGRLKPFSHLPGEFFVLPGSTYRLQIFPSRIQIDDLVGPLPECIAILDLEVRGPVDEFTILQNLERGNVQVSGKTQDGFLRYTLSALSKEAGIALKLEKGPKKLLSCHCEGKWKDKVSIQQGESHIFGAPSSSNREFFSPSIIERLSLGNSKAQDWELMRRRLDFTEIFPIWFRLGQLIIKDHQLGSGMQFAICAGSANHKLQARQQLEGTLALLEECRKAILSPERDRILEYFRRLFLVGFESGLSPRLSDTSFQGIEVPTLNPEAKCSSLQLLVEGAELIRSLFIQEDPQNLSLLPALPPEFHCGRFINISCGKGIFSIEWTKKALRAVIFSAKESQPFSLVCSKGEKVCRLRTSHADRGQRYIIGNVLDVVANQNYWFDNFER